MKFREEVFAVGGGNWDACLNQPAKPRGLTDRTEV